MFAQVIDLDWFPKGYLLEVIDPAEGRVGLLRPFQHEPVIECVILDDRRSAALGAQGAVAVIDLRSGLVEMVAQTTMSGAMRLVHLPRSERLVVVSRTGVALLCDASLAPKGAFDSFDAAGARVYDQFYGTTDHFRPAPSDAAEPGAAADGPAPVRFIGAVDDLVEISAFYGELAPGAVLIDVRPIDAATRRALTGGGALDGPQICLAEDYDAELAAQTEPQSAKIQVNLSAFTAHQIGAGLGPDDGAERGDSPPGPRIITKAEARPSAAPELTLAPLDWRAVAPLTTMQIPLDAVSEAAAIAALDAAAAELRAGGIDAMVIGDLSEGCLALGFERGGEIWSEERLFETAEEQDWPLLKPARALLEAWLDAIDAEPFFERTAHRLTGSAAVKDAGGPLAAALKYVAARDPDCFDLLRRYARKIDGARDKFCAREIFRFLKAERSDALAGDGRWAAEHFRLSVFWAMNRAVWTGKPIGGFLDRAGLVARAAPRLRPEAAAILALKEAQAFDAPRPDGAPTPQKLWAAFTAHIKSCGGWGFTPEARWCNAMAKALERSRALRLPT